MFLRGVAAFLGAFVLVNLIGGWFVTRFDANIWWIRLSPLPGWMGTTVLLSAGVVLVGLPSVPFVALRRGA